ncbi:MAG: hypothetical protein ACE5KM_18785 [Planctomycetaceae bacterium]
MKRLTALMLVCPVCVSLAFAAGPTSSKPVTAEKPDQSAKPNADAVRVLLQQLESGKYAERNAATKRLMAAGMEVIAPITKAAHTDDLELGARCVDILKHLYQHGDAATKAAAEASLKTLRSSKHASVAKWAGEALGRGNNRFGNNPFGNNRFGGRFGRRFGGGRIIIGGGAIPGGIAGPRGIEREAKVTEKGKTIHIKETFAPKRQIVVKVTEKVNGKEKTTEYKARTAADLRRKNKAIYDLYRKHIRGARIRFVAGNNLPIQIRMPQLPAGGGVGGITISSRTVNGQRQIDIQENGRKISISDNRGKEIVVKITETVNGKPQTTEHKAKDLVELKKKHPKAAKVYERFAGRRGNPFGGRAGLFPLQQPLQRPQRPPQ